MCLRLVILVMAMSILGRTTGQFQRMFQEPTILDKPAGTGKILIQSELKIDTVHMPDACKVKAKEGDTAVFDFDIWFNDNETKFATSEDTEEAPGEKMVFIIGKGMVIPGVEAGITNICIGEKRRLKIPPHLAWGEKGIPEVIPENAYVTFDLELLEIVPKTWSQWYIDMVQMICTIGFVVGTFYLLIQQVRASRKSRRDAARRERKRLKLRAQCAEEEEEDEEFEDEESDEEDEEDENEEEEGQGEEEVEEDDNTDLDKQNAEWTKFQSHAKSE
ncbi:FK506-binding protein 2B-like [Pecten maximus]|uniref:FK506-binding protein 2B-like n=1 Tax=Pecten maximus TaxID=6579 RepID=UPI0014590955|nr:FK506-binding protein 2B-like [Pecten maximus]